jgi:hypothetical protein
MLRTSDVMVIDTRVLDPDYVSMQQVQGHTLHSTLVVPESVFFLS